MLVCFSFFIRVLLFLIFTDESIIVEELDGENLVDAILIERYYVLKLKIE